MATSPPLVTKAPCSMCQAPVPATHPHLTQTACIKAWQQSSAIWKKHTQDITEHAYGMEKVIWYLIAQRKGKYLKLTADQFDTVPKDFMARATPNSDGSMVIEAARQPEQKTRGETLQ